MDEYSHRNTLSAHKKKKKPNAINPTQKAGFQLILQYIFIYLFIYLLVLRPLNKHPWAQMTRGDTHAWTPPYAGI